MLPVTKCRWGHFNPVRVICGNGSLNELRSVVSGGRVLLVTTPGFTARGVTNHVTDLAEESHMLVLDNIQPTPEIRKIENDCQMLEGESFDYVVGLGGGSAIDTAKALSYALVCGWDALRAWFESGQPLSTARALSVCAIPTTAGTGSEVTPYAAMWDKRRGKKYSLTSQCLFPRIALLDPLLTKSLPKETTIATGLDALSHSLEAIWNRNATPLASMYAIRATRIILNTLPRVVRSPDDNDARAQMMNASMLAGLAISSTRTALAHAMSYPITAYCGLPHGLACSFTLPAILDFNSEASDDDGYFESVCQDLGFESVRSFRQELVHFLDSLEVAEQLRNHVSSLDHLLGWAPKMLGSERAGNNLRSASVEDVKKLLAASWHSLLERV